MPPYAGYVPNRFEEHCKFCWVAAQLYVPSLIQFAEFKQNLLFWQFRHLFRHIENQQPSAETVKFQLALCRLALLVSPTKYLYIFTIYHERKSSLSSKFESQQLFASMHRIPFLDNSRELSRTLNFLVKISACLARGRFVLHTDVCIPPLNMLHAKRGGHSRCVLEMHLKADFRMVCLNHPFFLSKLK